ncbi:hypothetical protein [Nocardia miyunensis]|uniref:hypothetical protein n=1 Tax=Nocardia miyunensis TaxID=282684 RepID=UPI00082BB48E|nr:hypothetical protein [Nocardia miyunensis]
MAASDQITAPATPAGRPGADPASAEHRDRLLSAVERVAAELEAEAEACEAAGRMTDRALELLRGTGIGWGLVSADLGGLDMYPGELFPVLERIARTRPHRHIPASDG